MTQIIESLQELIKAGRLILVVTNSLAKFAMCGFDKFTGGVVQVYANDRHANTLNDTLFTQSRKDPFSKEANRFFHAIFSRCSSSVQNYLKIIRDNSNYLYGALTIRLTGSPNLIRLGVRDPDIPMLGFHFDSVLKTLGVDASDEDNLIKITHIMQYYLYALAAGRDLPLTLRASFGFSNTTCIECETALRLTPGVEDREILNAYPN